MSSGVPLATLQILYDDRDETVFTYDDADAWMKNWDGMQWSSFYGQSTMLSTLGPDMKPHGTLKFRFEGVAAAFVGTTPPASGTQPVVSIDGEQPYNIAYPESAFAYVQWYKTPTLSPGNHTVSISYIEGMMLDYAIVDVAPNTDPTNQTVVVDDNHPDIQYSGSWTQKGRFSASYGWGFGGFPFGNGTHSTFTVGDRIAFSFSGSRLKIYGMFNWAQPGVLGAEFTIDGTSYPYLYPVTPTSSLYRGGSGDSPNFLFFSSDTISPGEHTVVITVTQVVNIAFALDFITYTPNYETPDTKPRLSPPAFPTTSSSPASTTVTGSGSKATQDALTADLNSTSKATTLIIIVSVVGSITIMALCIMVAILWKRRYRKREQDGRVQVATLQDGLQSNVSVGGVFIRGAQLGRGFRAAEAAYACLTTRVTPYINAGPISQPTNQGLKHPIHGLTRSVSDPGLPYTHRFSGVADGNLGDDEVRSTALPPYNAHL